MCMCIIVYNDLLTVANEEIGDTIFSFLLMNNSLCLEHASLGLWSHMTSRLHDRECWNQYHWCRLLPCIFCTRIMQSQDVVLTKEVMISRSYVLSGTGRCLETWKLAHRIAHKIRQTWDLNTWSNFLVQSNSIPHDNDLIIPFAP